MSIEKGSGMSDHSGRGQRDGGGRGSGRSHNRSDGGFREGRSRSDNSGRRYSEGRGRSSGNSRRHQDRDGSGEERQSFKNDNSRGRRNDSREDRRDSRQNGGRYDRDDRGRRGGQRGSREEFRGGRGAGRRSSRGHSQRAGQNQRGFGQTGPQRSGFREERIQNRLNEPKIPEGIDPRELDPSVREELRSLSKDNADMVAKHLIMAATLLDENPQKALEHARAAKERAGRVAVARETNGIAAYHAGEWREAISELRAARRMSGGPGLLPVLADAERGLGRPQKAIEVANEYMPSQLDPESRVELAIIVAGAHQDMRQFDEAVLALQAETGSDDAPKVSQMRVRYAYADALEQAGRSNEAIEWFERAEELDSEGMLDSKNRIAEINKTH